MLCRSRALLLATLLIALWPVWRWVWLRGADGSGDHWELLAAATAIALLVRDRDLEPVSTSASLPIALILIYAASYIWVPPLVRGLLAMAAVGTACSTFWYGRRLHLPLCGLLLISLPVMPSLNFYLGYPLRVVVGAAAEVLLRSNGIAATREGALLLWNGESIAIDAPCSGVKMLWTGAYLCLSLAGLLRLTTLHTLALAAATLATVMIANVLRATSLFYVEAKLIAAPPFAHEAVGLVAFALTACAVFAVSRKLAVITHAR